MRPRWSICLPCSRCLFLFPGLKKWGIPDIDYLGSRAPGWEGPHQLFPGSTSFAWMWLALHLTVSQSHHSWLSHSLLLGMPPQIRTVQLNIWAMISRHCSGLLWAIQCGVKGPRQGQSEGGLKDLKKQNQFHVAHKWPGAIFPEFRFLLHPLAAV